MRSAWPRHRTSGRARRPNSEGALLDRRRCQCSRPGRHEPLSWQTLLSGRNPDPRRVKPLHSPSPFSTSSPTSGPARRRRPRSERPRIGSVPDNGVTVRHRPCRSLGRPIFDTLSQGAASRRRWSIGLLCAWLLVGLRSLRLSIAILVTLIVRADRHRAAKLPKLPSPLSAHSIRSRSPSRPCSSASPSISGSSSACAIAMSVSALSICATALGRAAAGVGMPLTVAALATAAGFFAFVPTDYTLGVSGLGLHRRRRHGHRPSPDAHPFCRRSGAATPAGRPRPATVLPRSRGSTASAAPPAT